jgi:hypothetical protein
VLRDHSIGRPDDHLVTEALAEARDGQPAHVRRNTSIQLPQQMRSTSASP